MGLSIRAYARHRQAKGLPGQTDTAVRKAIAAGRIKLGADGLIDPATADAAWGRSTDPAKQQQPPPRRERGAPPLKPVPPEALDAVGDTLREQGLSTAAPSAGGMTFLQARTANEVLKAQDRRLRLQKARGELVDRARATALVFRLAREERDAWLNWPARVSAVIAASLGVEAHPVQQAMDEHVRAHLAELAEIRLEFR